MPAPQAWRDIDCFINHFYASSSPDWGLTRQFGRYPGDMFALKTGNRQFRLTRLTGGVIFRDHRPTIPPEVTYGLTEREKELGDVLDELELIARRWGLVSKAENSSSSL